MTEIPKTGLKPGTNARQNAGDLRLKKVSSSLTSHRTFDIISMIAIIIVGIYNACIRIGSTIESCLSGAAFIFHVVVEILTSESCLGFGTLGWQGA